MILLDTDHLTMLTFPDNPRCERLTARLSASLDTDVATTVVNVEEQFRGWMAKINRYHDIRKQIPAYERLLKLINFLSRLQIVPFDAGAADKFEYFRHFRTHLGTMDLKIGCIALSRDALLLSANLRDFRQLPGLRVENWLD